jgi:hypothetical protein
MAKRALWADILVEKHGEVADFWCCLEDFNFISEGREESGGSCVSGKRREGRSMIF